MTIGHGAGIDLPAVGSEQPRPADSVGFVKCQDPNRTGAGRFDFHRDRVFGRGRPSSELLDHQHGQRAADVRPPIACAEAPGRGARPVAALTPSPPRNAGSPSSPPRASAIPRLPRRCSSPPRPSRPISLTPTASLTSARVTTWVTPWASPVPEELAADTRMHKRTRRRAPEPMSVAVNLSPPAVVCSHDWVQVRVQASALPGLAGGPARDCPAGTASTSAFSAEIDRKNCSVSSRVMHRRFIDLCWGAPHVRAAFQRGCRTKQRRRRPLSVGHQVTILGRTISVAEDPLWPTATDDWTCRQSRRLACATAQTRAPRRRRRRRQHRDCLHRYRAGPARGSVRNAFGDERFSLTNDKRTR
jgi:hypothetical protein